MSFIFQTLYLLLPAYLGNASATVTNRWKFMDTPLDLGKKIGNNFIFGRNKTYRGVLVCLAVAFATALIQYIINLAWPALSLIDYERLNWPLFGILSGLGAVSGDLLASFFKRRLGMADGRPLPIIDQLDFILGFLVFTSILINYSVTIIIWALVLTAVIHPLSNIAAYLLKLKAVWW